MKSSPQTCSGGRFVAWMAALSVVMTIGGLGCKKEAPVAPPPPTVVILELATTNMPLSTEIIGLLDSPQNVQIRARVEAFVDKMLFEEGREVKEGDLLFELDKKPFVEQLAAAKGVLGQAEAALKKFETDVARLKPLAEKRAVPQQDLDNALAAVEQGRAAVLSAQAQMESAQLDLGYCEVRAPISGLIGAKQVSIGDLVGKGEPTLLATISTLNPIWFYCNVSEVEYLRAESEIAKKGRRIADAGVTLMLSNGSEHPDKGKFVFVDRAVDIKTGTLRVRAEFANPQQILRPGMFGRINVDLGTRADSILVPQRAVLELQGKNFVWVITSENKAEQRPVTVGQQIGGNLLILNGLKAGERVVLEGTQKVREGTTVQPMTAAQMAAAAAQAAPTPGKTHAKE